MNKIVMMVLVSLFLVGMSSTARALVLDTSYTPTIGGVLATTGALNYNLYGSQTLGTIAQNVYSNTTGLVFAFDLNMTSTTNASAFDLTLGASDYYQHIVKVGYQADASKVAPSSATDNFGLITFTWGTDTLSAGETSPTLYIQTDLPYITAGTFSLQGRNSENASKTQNFDGFAPTAVPEPASASLLGMGLFGLLGFRRKKQA